MSTPTIEIHDLNFSYGSVRVLEGVDLILADREPISIIGPNGGGKTTLLKLILGLLEPDSGSIRVLGKPPRTARSRIGYMPQYLQFDMAFPLTVLDLVLMGRLGRRLGGFYSKNDREIARRALADVGLSDLEKRQFAQLSGGQRQRALIARALACEPEILLLDEPTANVDMVLEEQLLQTLRQIHEQMAIILVTHDIGFVSQLVEKVVCVNRQVVVHPTSAITGSNIEEIYGGHVHAVHHDHRE